MSLEVVTFIVATLALIGTVWQVKLAYDQRKLAREQADMRPKLKVNEMRLIELNDKTWPGMSVKRFREEREWKVQWEREREKREAEERKREAERSPQERRLHEELKRTSEQFQAHIAATSPSRPASSTPYHETPEGYEGPIPDKVLLIPVANVGNTAAYEVTGWLRLEASHLEPAPIFSNFNPIVSSEGEAYKVKVGGTENSTLMPTEDARLYFQIAVVVHSSGKTRVSHEFTTPMGAGEKGYEVLEV